MKGELVHELHLSVLPSKDLAHVIHKSVWAHRQLGIAVEQIVEYVTYRHCAVVFGWATKSVSLRCWI
jgi:hypothetical protein